MNNLKIILILLLILCYQLIAQDSTKSTDKPLLYIYAEKLPRFNIEGGLKNYVYSNIKWPDMFCGEGTVLVSFVVQKNGKVNNVKIERGLCIFCDDEVIRVFNSMPDWLPGEVDSKPVDVKLYFPVEFKLK
jgi:protein TonB